MSTIRGFNVVRARGAGMDWLVVSDASTEALKAFAARLERGDAAP